MTTKKSDKTNSSKSSKTTHQSVSAKSGSKKDNLDVPSLKAKLREKSRKELITLILRFFKDYEGVREYFEQEAFAEFLVADNSIVKLVEKAIKMINKGMGNLSYHSYYDGGVSCDFKPVIDIVRQLGKFDNFLDAVDRVVKHLLKKGGKFFEETGTEDASDFEEVLQEISKLLIASKISPVSIILWVYEMWRVDDYCLCESTLVKDILNRDWSVKIWSEVADAMLGKMYENVAENWRDEMLRAIINVLDKAHRQEEATNLLRAEAVRVGEQEMLVKRLIKFGFLDEAEKLASEQHKIKLAENGFDTYNSDQWSSYLKEIADKKQNWATKASIEAMEFFKYPSVTSILALLSTAKKMKIESAVRLAIEIFLQTGKLPAAVQKCLNNVKPTAKDCANWRIPFFVFRLNESKIIPRFDVLCKWAIAEKRPNDVVYWFDEIAKQKSPRGGMFEVTREEVADAIINSHPERAFKLYSELAEYEMEDTRNYSYATQLLQKVRKALENMKRTADWQKILTEIRTKHRRKSNLMKLLDKL
ncbi:MAG: hypothetical protein LBL39_07740 [Planctomycetaceae bacterium]|jgi:hypothetical protein|nr:hypothetical protein [Planctomycetaceae bacterium]